MGLTYVDSSVLIAAANTSGLGWRRAVDCVLSAERQFVATTFVRLETVPKAAYNGHQGEVEFYSRYFLRVAVWVTVNEELMQSAMRLGLSYGLSGSDAVHGAAALAAGADELVTREKPGRPFFRLAAEGLKVRSILEPDDDGEPDEVYR